MFYGGLMPDRPAADLRGRFTRVCHTYISVHMSRERIQELCEPMAA